MGGFVFNIFIIPGIRSEVEEGLIFGPFG